MADPDDEPAPSLDTFERVVRAAVEAPPRVVLGEGAVVAERYVVRQRVGAGGMGTVYRAHDRVLARDVALKLHHGLVDRTALPFGSADVRGVTPPVVAAERTHREAIAMAKLSHPNVVTVYEVGTHAGSTFVAMEYVAGSTLREWLGAKVRSRVEILEALGAAGVGLAAAHAVGLVHRDVKPDNIFVGFDGRVRVGDFGLAKVFGLGETAGEGGAVAPTETAFAGTPAYMAPEQLVGAELDARTDQYAFAVVAWEALAGARPASASQPSSLAYAETVDSANPNRRVAVATTTPSDGKLPAPLARVLRRGMATDPAARFSSVLAMIRALTAAQRRPRLIAAAIAGMMIVGTGLAWALWPVPDPLAICEAVGDRLELMLPRQVEAVVLASVRGSGATDAAARAALIEGAVGRLRLHYRDVARSTCAMTVQHTWSPQLAAVSRECLDTAGYAARALLTALPPRADTVADLVQLAAQMPSVTSCGDAKLLAGRRSVADEGSDLIETQRARGRIDAASRLVDLGRGSTALALSLPVAQSTVAQTRAVAPRLALLDASARLAMGNLAGVEHDLSTIYFAARADDDGELMLQTVTQLITLTALLRRDKPAAAQWIANAVADAEREHTRLPLLAATAITSAAAAVSDEGGSNEALKRIDRADAIAGPNGPATDRAARIGVRLDALASMGKLEDALKMSDVQIAMLSAALGARHPAVANAYASRATILIDGHRLQEALDAAVQVDELLNADPESNGPSAISARLAVGVTLLTVGQSAAAREYLEQARRFAVEMYGEDHPDIAKIDSNLALVYLDLGERDRALAMLRHSITVQERFLGLAHQDLGVALFNLAVAERDGKEYEPAAGHARRAIVIFETAAPGSVRHAMAYCLVAGIENLAEHYDVALAAAEVALGINEAANDSNAAGWARLEAAHALLGQHRNVPRTRKLLTEARGYYAAARLDKRVREVDALLAGLR